MVLSHKELLEKFLSDLPSLLVEHENHWVYYSPEGEIQEIKEHEDKKSLLCFLIKHPRLEKEKALGKKIKHEHQFKFVKSSKKENSVEIIEKCKCGKFRHRPSTEEDLSIREVFHKSNPTPCLDDLKKRLFHLKENPDKMIKAFFYYIEKGRHKEKISFKSYDTISKNPKKRIIAVIREYKEFTLILPDLILLEEIF